MLAKSESSRWKLRSMPKVSSIFMLFRTRENAINISLQGGPALMGFPLVVNNLEKPKNRGTASPALSLENASGSPHGPLSGSASWGLLRAREGS